MSSRVCNYNIGTRGCEQKELIQTPAIKATRLVKETPLLCQGVLLAVPLDRTITVRNYSHGPPLSVPCSKESGTAAVSVSRFPNGASFGEPVKEFDPRPVRDNIGDAQHNFLLRRSRLRDFHICTPGSLPNFINGDDPWRDRRRKGSIENWTERCL
jgi:hypothetical protein